MDLGGLDQNVRELCRERFLWEWLHWLYRWYIALPFKRNTEFSWNPNDLIQEVNEFILEFQQLDMEESATDDEDKDNGEEGGSQEDIDVVSVRNRLWILVNDDRAFDSEED